jgi:hypothetical protein
MCCAASVNRCGRPRAIHALGVGQDAVGRGGEAVRLSRPGCCPQVDDRSLSLERGTSTRGWRLEPTTEGAARRDAHRTCRCRSRATPSLLAARTPPPRFGCRLGVGVSAAMVIDRLGVGLGLERRAGWCAAGVGARPVGRRPRFWPHGRTPPPAPSVATAPERTSNTSQDLRPRAHPARTAAYRHHGRPTLSLRTWSPSHYVHATVADAGPGRRTGRPGYGLGQAELRTHGSSSCVLGVFSRQVQQGARESSPVRPAHRATIGQDPPRSRGVSFGRPRGSSPAARLPGGRPG